MKTNLPKLFMAVAFSLCINQHAFSQLQYSQSGSYSAQLHLGSQGIGADFRYGLTEKLSGRIGGSIIPVKANNVFTLQSFQSRASVSANFSNVHLLADYAPFESVQWLKFVVGGAYLFKANGGADLVPTGNYNVGGYKISREEVGTLNIDINWKGPAPYLGLNLLNTFPQNKFNINIDLGTYYLKQPRSTITGTNMLSENYLLEPRLNSNISNYRWMPVLQLNLNYKLNAY